MSEPDCRGTLRPQAGDRRIGICLVLAAGIAVAVAWGFDFVRLEQLLRARFGDGQVSLLRAWQRTLSDSRSAGERAKLERINDFVNSRIQFEDDLSTWNTSEYWATPLETIGQGRGDCEDFAIFKYYSLKEAGIPLSKLRLVYVKARLEGPAGPYMQAHMVLAFYPTPTSEPLVLDNLIPEIRPASQRKDLLPIFSFNSEAIWTGVAGNSAKGPGGTNQLSPWQNLLQRARKEGVE